VEKRCGPLSALRDAVRSSHHILQYFIDCEDEAQKRLVSYS
jgi:hypothetical protein